MRGEDKNYWHEAMKKNIIAEEMKIWIKNLFLQ